MRTNDLVSLYVSFVETNGGKSRPVLIRRVSEQTVETFKITSQYENKSAYIKQQYYPIQDWQSASFTLKLDQNKEVLLCLGICATTPFL